MQPNKAIVGRNAFAHESGIHQDGVLKERTTYETMDATGIGLDSNSIVVGKQGVRTPDREEAVGSFTGDGPAAAIFHAINAATGVDARLREFRIEAVTGGQDALGETSVVLEVDGVVGSGQGVSTDILDAAGRAYARALSNALRRQRVQAEAEADAVPTP